jgi:hypothetical protein
MGRSDKVKKITIFCLEEEEEAEEKVEEESFLIKSKIM